MYRYPEIDLAREPNRARVWLLTTGQIQNYAEQHYDKQWSQDMADIADKVRYLAESIDPEIYFAFTNLLLETYPHGNDRYGRPLDTPKRGDVIYLEPELERIPLDNGKYIYNGQMIIPFIENLSPEFKVPEEFPINYWKGRLIDYGFYFPFRQMFRHINLNDLEILQDIVLFEFYDKNGIKYTIVRDLVDEEEVLLEFMTYNYFRPLYNGEYAELNLDYEHTMTPI